MTKRLSVGLQLMELATRKTTIGWETPLKSVLETMKAPGSPYRAPVVDSEGKFRGMISKRRILEVLIGTRGSALGEKEGYRSLLQEPVYILIDESHQVFSEDSSTKMVLEYMAENSVGHVVVADHNNNYKGMVDEQDILRGLRGIRFDVPVGGLMKKEVVSIGPEAPVYEASRLMVQRRVRRLPVSKLGILWGILTVGKIVEHACYQMRESHLGFKNIERMLSGKVGEISVRAVQTCLPSTELGEAIDSMLRRDISGMPVTTEGHAVVGIFTRVDAVVALVRRLGAEAMTELMG